MSASPHDLSNFIWGVADVIRGPYRPPQYERVMLPMTVLRRFDCVLAGTKARVVAEAKLLASRGLEGPALESRLNKVAGQGFHNRSDFDFQVLKGDPDALSFHLGQYIAGFSENVRRIFEFFEFDKEIELLHEHDRLYLVVAKFADIDLHPDLVSNLAMGHVFEDLIRRFNEQANETAGDHFTPREVIELMVDLLFAPDDDLLSRPGIVRTLCDPACGTGGMLATAQNHLRAMNPQAVLEVYGQDYNKRSYAVCASDMLIKGQEHAHVEFGDSIVNDRFPGHRFDYLLANSPFGVDWKTQQKTVEKERARDGTTGRFAAGLPRVNDGSLLFLQGMVAHFEEHDPAREKHGTRLAIVFNGSPLFTGGAGSGESDIRRWLIENDRLEAIVALPESMFYNTGIGTYVWIVTNRKSDARRGCIQLLDARERWLPMRRSLGDKRRFLGPEDIAAVVREYGDFTPTPTSKLFDNADFGYRRLTVERPLRLRVRFTPEARTEYSKRFPGSEGFLEALEREFPPDVDHVDWNVDKLRFAPLVEGLTTEEQKAVRELFVATDPAAEPVVRRRLKGGVLVYDPDPALRDFENVPLKEDPEEYFRREVLPHVPDAWVEWDKTKIGYEINFNRHFYRHTPPRALEEIDSELKAVEAEIVRMLTEVTT